jgi:hypothetical protein
MISCLLCGKEVTCDQRYRLNADRSVCHVECVSHTQKLGQVSHTQGQVSHTQEESRAGEDQGKAEVKSKPDLDTALRSGVL